MSRQMQLLLGLGIIAAAGAYFLLKPKDAEAAPLPPYVPPQTPSGEITPPGTMVQASQMTPAAPAAPVISPMLRAQITPQVQPTVLNPKLFASGGSAGSAAAPQLTNLLRSGALKF